MAKKIEIIKTKYGFFSCVFEPEKDMGGYMVVARRAHGAFSWGKNIAEARRMIVEVIEGIIEMDVLIEAEKAGLVKIKHQKVPAAIA